MFSGNTTVPTGMLWQGCKNNCIIPVTGSAKNMPLKNQPYKSIL